MSNGKPTQKLVEVEWEYLTIGEDGTPKTITETWYAYFTFRSMSEMYKRMGFDEGRAHEIAQEMDDEDGGGDTDPEAFLKEARQEVEVTDIEANYYLIWAAFQWHARQKGITLTPDMVADRITTDNVEDILIEVQRALQAFETGTLPSREDIIEEQSEAEPDMGKGPSPRKRGDDG
jgi:hypothetical protein